MYDKMKRNNSLNKWVEDGLLELNAESQYKGLKALIEDDEQLTMCVM